MYKYGTTDVACTKKLPEELEPTPDASLDHYLNASVVLPRGYKFARGKVISFKREPEGCPIGRANAHLVLDTRKYEVEFGDGDITDLTADVIVESMYAQVNSEVNDTLLTDCMVYYRRNEDALTIQDHNILAKGRPSLRRSTVRWFICTQWKDGSTSWEKLSDTKECYPIETAEYEVAQVINKKPVYNWWVGNVLRNRDAIILAVKQRNAKYLKRTHKFCIEVPKTVAEAISLDEKNGDNLRKYTIAKGMENTRAALKIISECGKPPPGYQKIRFHMIFDIKMEDFRRKEVLAEGGHVTEPTATTTYASVASMETVRIALTVAALNDLQVRKVEIQNAYIQAPVAENI